jgi:hypothetical protein
LWNNSPKCCWFFVTSCNMCKNYKRCMGHLKKNMLLTNSKYIKSSIILRWRKAP